MSISAGPGQWALAQINVARLIAPKGSAAVQPFFDALDWVTGLADANPGFLWRLKGEGGDATDLNPTGDDRVIVNMSAWASWEALFEFVYQSDHRPVMARRREWFERPSGAYQALWWIGAGEWPSPEEGLARLHRLRRFGPSPEAFTFKVHFPAPSGAAEEEPVSIARRAFMGCSS